MDARGLTANYGKKGDTFKVRHSGRMYECHMRMTERRDGKFIFTATHSRARNDTLVCSGDDPAAAKKAMQEYIKAQDSVEWTAFILIETKMVISGSNATDDVDDVLVSVKFDRVEQGKREDGTTMHRHMRLVRDTWEPGAVSEGEIDLDPYVDWDDQDYEKYGLIPFTQENWDMMTRFNERLSDIGREIVKTMSASSKTIVASLGESILNLPGPKKRKKK